ncbi:MAG: alpha/beta hydrolase fold domain-containing protein [Candidatus Binatia bacterium]
MLRKVLLGAFLATTNLALANPPPVTPPPVALPPVALPPGVRMESGVVYVERGDVPIAGDLFLPSGAGPFPVVVLIHGGGWASGDKKMMHPTAARLAGRGYAAFAIGYRLAPKHRYPAPLEDCRAAVGWLHANAKKHSLDASRIAAWGYSAGAHLAALLATTGNERGGERIAAAVVIAGPSDLLRLASVDGGTPAAIRVLPPFLGGGPKERRDGYLAASPIRHVDAGDPPMFLVHGALDEVVPFDQAEAFAGALEGAGVKAVLFRAENTTHASMSPSLSQGITAAIEFLDGALSASSATDPGTRH